MLSVSIKNIALLVSWLTEYLNNESDELTSKNSNNFIQVNFFIIPAQI